MINFQYPLMIFLSIDLQAPVAILKFVGSLKRLQDDRCYWLIDMSVAELRQRVARRAEVCPEQIQLTLGKEYLEIGQLIYVAFRYWIR